MGTFERHKQAQADLQSAIASRQGHESLVPFMRAELIAWRDHYVPHLSTHDAERMKLRILANSAINRVAHMFTDEEKHAILQVFYLSLKPKGEEHGN